jgi:hypothetical protein
MDMINETSQWIVIKDKQLSPGIYRLQNESLTAKSLTEAHKHDKVRIMDSCYPVGTVLGIDVYECLHIPTNQHMYITSGEITK